MKREAVQRQEIDPRSSPLEYLWNLTPLWNRRYRIRPDFNIHISKLPIKGTSPSTVFVTFYSLDMPYSKILNIMWQGEQAPAETWQVTKSGAWNTTTSDDFTTPIFEELISRRISVVVGAYDEYMGEQEEKQRTAVSLAHYVHEQLRRKVDGNEGLPLDAREYYSPRDSQILKDLCVEETEFLKIHGTVPELDSDELKKFYSQQTGIATRVELSSDHNETFHHQPHPEVKGYRWQRGIAVEVIGATPTLVGKNQVFIFTGWTTPLEKSGSPEPLVYIDGNVDSLDVMHVVEGYATERKSAMEKARTSPKTSSNR